MLTDEQIKDMWGNECTICGTVMEERHLVSAIVPLTVTKPHCNDYVTKTYCVCTECYESKELV